MRRFRNFESLETRHLLAIDITSSAGIVFEAPQITRIGSENIQIEGAVYVDIDQDGDEDLIAGNRRKEISVALMNDRGEFEFQKESYQVSESILNMLAVDLNHDGWTDLVASSQGHVYSYLATHANGSWQGFELLQSLKIQTNSLDVGDIDGDGQLDLVVAREFVSVMTGNSDGLFEQSIRYGAKSESNSRKAILADVDQDDDLDLVMTDGNEITIVANDGGIFDNEIDRFQVASRSWISSLHIADANQDGVHDLLLGDRNAEHPHLFIHPGKQAGRFDHDGLSFEILGPPRDVKLADMNLDGRIDIVVGHDGTFHHPVNNNGPGGVSVLLANDANSFHPAIRITTPNADRVFVDDLNADGLPDIIATQFDSISTFMQSTPEFFEPQQTKFNAVGSYDSKVAFGDFNHDGKTDFLVTLAEGANQRFSLQALLSTDNDDFVTKDLTLPQSAYVLKVGNFDSDPEPEIVVGVTDFRRSEIQLIEFDDEFEFAKPKAIKFQTDSVIYETLDLNQDGIDDLLIWESDAVFPYFGTASGDFEKGNSITNATRGYRPILTDFNNDQLTDMIVYTSNDDFRTFLGSGDGMFQETSRIAFSFANVQLGDFNADKIIDIAYTSFRTDFINIRHGLGDGRFSELQQIEKLSESYFAVDANDDGRTDLLFSAFPTLVELRSTAEGFERVSERDAPGFRQIVEADLNRDGINELLGIPGGFSTAAQAQFTVIQPEKIETYSFSNSLLEIDALSDIDSDGDVDIVARSPGGFMIVNGRSETPNADLNQDGQINVTDIDWLCQQVANGSNESRFDLNGDAVIDRDDVTFAVERLFKTSIGDVNLDGQFNSADLVNVFQAAEYEDQIPSNSKWSTGDWNCDGEFGTADLVLAFEKDTYVSEAKRLKRSSDLRGQVNEQAVAGAVLFHQNDDLFARTL